MWFSYISFQDNPLWFATVICCCWFAAIQIISLPRDHCYYYISISIIHPISYWSAISWAADLLGHISSQVQIQRVHWSHVKDEPGSSGILTSCWYFYWDAYWLCNHLTGLVLHLFTAPVIHDSAETDWPFVTIIFTFLLVPCDSHTFFFFCPQFPSVSSTFNFVFLPPL